MSLRKKFRSAEGGEEMDTGPLNDILFILMFFFLILSTLANPNVIRLTNPKASADARAKQTVTVSINKNLNYFIGRDAVLFDSLESELRSHIITGDSIRPAVLINADTSVPINEVVKVMAISKKLGASSSLAVSPQ
jgi:biopolymer transport protein ExbD